MLLNFRDASGRPMEPDLIRDEIASMFLAGHETTALTLTWAFYLLACHPDAEAKLHAELATVLGGRTPEFGDVEKLVYTRAIVDETLRLYPPVHVFSREAIADDMIEKVRVPAGSFISISSWILHRHREFWVDPEAFRPERFLPANAGQIVRYAYIPFGGGPRMCLGKHLGLLESVMLLALLAQRHRFRLAPNFVPVPLGRMTLRPKAGMPMSVQPRE